MASKSIGLVIEGVGRTVPTSGSSKGIAWYIGHSSLNGTVTDSYEWIGGPGAQAGLVDIPSSVGTQVDPFDVTISGSSFSFQLHKSDLAGELFMTRAQSDSYLGQALTDIATTIQLSSANNLYPWGLADEGRVIWVGDEAILLGTFDASTGNFQSCTRGYYSTIAQTLPTGMSVYRRNPYRENRRAVLLEYNHDTSTTTQIWQGFVTDFDADSPIINIQTVELLSVLQRGVVNRGKPNGASFAASTGGGGVAIGFVRMDDGTDRERRVNKHSANSTHWVALQHDQSLYYAKFDGTDDRADLIDVTGSYSGGSQPQLESGFNSPEPGAPGGTYEVFVVDRLRDESNTGTNIRSSTRDLESVSGDSRPYHAVAIAMALSTSGYDDGVGPSNGDYDVLGFQWGLGIPITFFDATSISDLIDASPNAVIDRMVLGWDGERVDWMPVVRNLLRARGFFLGHDEQGRIIFARLRMPSIADLCGNSAVNPIPRELRWQPAEGEGVDQLRGRIGRLPWFDGQPYEANVLGDTELLRPASSFRQGVFGEVKSAELDLPYLAPKTSKAELGELISLTAFRGQGAPRITIRVNSSTFAIGDMVKVADPQLRDKWFHDPDGNLVTPDDSVRWFGQIVGMQQNLRDSTHTLTILLTNYFGSQFARYRAPSGEIAALFQAGGASTNEYVISATKFYTSDQPATAFTAGDKVELWTAQGTRRSGTAASPDVRTIQASPSLTSVVKLDSDFTTTAQVGDILRLAKLDDASGYPEDGNPLVVIDGVTIDCALAYTFLADTSETLATSDIAGHIYDGRI